MKKIILLIFLGIHFTTCYTQNQFNNAIISLQKDLQFEETSESYVISEKPEKNFIKKFRRCSKSDFLKNLSALNFDEIIASKSIDLITKKWDGNWKIWFQEWTFISLKSKNEFLKILNSLQKNQFQDCINKGGIMWISKEDKIYLVTSSAYFLTYHFNEIKNSIVKGIQK